MTKKPQSMKEYAELKNVEMNDMVLLHEEDLHFNLVVSNSGVCPSDLMLVP